MMRTLNTTHLSRDSFQENYDHNFFTITIYQFIAEDNILLKTEWRLRSFTS